MKNNLAREGSGRGNDVAEQASVAPGYDRALDGFIPLDVFDQAAGGRCTRFNHSLDDRTHTHTLCVSAHHQLPGGEGSP